MMDVSDGCILALFKERASLFPREYSSPNGHLGRKSNCTMVNKQLGAATRNQNKIIKANVRNNSKGFLQNSKGTNLNVSKWQIKDSDK